MVLVGDYQRVEFLIWLDSEQLVLLALSYLQQLLNLFLLAHLGLLLLLLEVLLLNLFLLNLFLLLFQLGKPLAVPLVQLAFLAVVNRDNKHRGGGLGMCDRLQWRYARLLRTPQLCSLLGGDHDLRGTFDVFFFGVFLPEGLLELGGRLDVLFFLHAGRPDESHRLNDLVPNLAQLGVLVEVGLLVGGQITGLRESLVAVRVGANVGLFTSVST